MLRMEVVLLMMLRRALVTGREVTIGHLLVFLIRTGVMWRLSRSGHWPLLDADLILIEDRRGECGGLVSHVRLEVGIVSGVLVRVDSVDCRGLSHVTWTAGL